MNDSGKKPLIADLADIAPVDCPCGQARRAFIVPDNSAASTHSVFCTMNFRWRIFVHPGMIALSLLLDGGKTCFSHPGRRWFTG